MAALQGYLLQHRDSPQSALVNIHSLPKSLASNQIHSQVPPSDSVLALESEMAWKEPVQPRPVRRLTVEEVDKMVFNPQQNWDKDL